MKILCRLFEHSWKYFFSPSDSYSKTVDIRVCKYCNKVQQHKQISPFLGREAKSYWMTMVGYTKKGAKNYWGELV